MLNSLTSWKSRDPPFVKTLTPEHVSINNHVLGMESLCRKLWEKWVIWPRLGQPPVGADGHCGT
eukprot:10916645-Ditylum_brightwellii.AAC.1